MKKLFVSALVVAFVASLAPAFDWETLVPPPSSNAPEDDSSATGSAAARGIDEAGTVARIEGDARAVTAVERAEPRQEAVEVFIAKAGLAPGKSPSFEPSAAPGGVSPAAAGLGILKDLDPTGYAGAASQAARGLVGLSPAEEHELGRRIAAQVIAQYGRDRNPDAEKYVNLVAAVLGRNSDRPELHYHAAILATDEVNAFSAPGGYLFVTRGALRLIADEAELAGVLAHEIAHVSERHVLNEMRRASLLGGALSIARNQGFTSEQYGVMANFGRDLVSKGLSREDELGADGHGAVCAERAGYGSRGLGRFLERLRDRQQDRGRGLALFRTHPPAQDRLAALTRDGHAGGGDKPLADRFRRFLPPSS